MMNGKERNVFTTLVNIWFSRRFGAMPNSVSVTQSSTPRGKPNTKEKIVYSNTINKVSTVASPINCSNSAKLILLPPKQRLIFA
jgi:hypothetical protein